jgi:hypothetical protein
MKNKNKDILNNIKGTGFETPDDYFAQFENDMQNKMKTLHTGFKVPDDYFENFETQFNKEDKLTSLKAPGFKTPDNYFENIDETILSKIRKSKVIPLKRNFFIKMAGWAIAASLLLFFSISKFNLNNDPINTVADTEIEAWLEEGLVSFNTFDIEYVFSDEDLDLIAEETDEVSDYLKYTDIEVLLLEN